MDEPLPTEALNGRLFPMRDPYANGQQGSAFDTNTLEQARVSALWRWTGIGSKGDMPVETQMMPSYPLPWGRNFAVRPGSLTNLNADPTWRTGYLNEPDAHGGVNLMNVATNVGTVALFVLLTLAILQSADR